VTEHSLEVRPTRRGASAGPSERQDRPGTPCARQALRERQRPKGLLRAGGARCAPPPPASASNCSLDDLSFPWGGRHETHRRLLPFSGLFRRAPRKFTEARTLVAQTGYSSGGSRPIDPGRVFGRRGPRLRQGAPLGTSSGGQRPRSPVAPRFGSQRDGPPLYDGHRH
jgi:hypothetical protein